MQIIISLLILGLLPFQGVANQTGEKMEKLASYSFPKAEYKDFATAEIADAIDPKIAYPKVQEFGLPRLTIGAREKSFAEVSFNLLTLKLKVPNGWHSFGGFDPMNKVFLTKEKWNGSSPTPLPNVGLKILDSKALNTSKFEDVQNKVLEMTLGNENYSEVGLYSNPEKKYFIIEAKTVKRSDGKIASQFDIYFQDPTPNSSLWMDLQMAVEKKEAAKHKGLLGLLFNDSKVNWTELKRVISKF